jgi:hypothetical protein
MPANFSPIFPLTPQVAFTTITGSNTATDGTGTVNTIFTAGTNGSRVDYIRCRALGTNVATVLRVFINSGSNATATNNSLFEELSLPTTAASNTAEISGDYDIALNLSLPAAYKINVVLGTAVAAGWKVTAVGGDY